MAYYHARRSTTHMSLRKSSQMEPEPRQRSSTVLLRCITNPDALMSAEVQAQCLPVDLRGDRRTIKLVKVRESLDQPGTAQPSPPYALSPQATLIFGLSSVPVESIPPAVFELLVFAVLPLDNSLLPVCQPKCNRLKNSSHFTFFTGLSIHSRDKSQTSGMD